MTALILIESMLVLSVLGLFYCIFVRWRLEREIKNRKYKYGDPFGYEKYLENCKEKKK